MKSKKLDFTRALRCALRAFFEGRPGNEAQVKADPPPRKGDLSPAQLADLKATILSLVEHEAEGFLLQHEIEMAKSIEALEEKRDRIAAQMMEMEVAARSAGPSSWGYRFSES